jgi:xylan 1,4-beta-xylosidase
LVNGGVDITQKPIWIEGPHLYKRDGFYYLMCAEGGTGPEHAEVIFRSPSLDGQFEPLPYPILTQRDLDPKRANPVECVGHADMIETDKGEWWAVFLGTRPYGQGFYATGRETFLLPVTWNEEGWPIILPAGEALPYGVGLPALPPRHTPETLGRTGNFQSMDSFYSDSLGKDWVFHRTPSAPFLVLDDIPGIRLVPGARELSSLQGASYIGRRQQHTDYEATAVLDLTSLRDGTLGGLAVYQSENAYLVLGVSRKAAGDLSIGIEQMNRGNRRVRQTTSLGSDQAGNQLTLGVRENAGLMDLWFLDASGSRNYLVQSMDSTFLTTAVAGGFVGSTIGLHARRK